MSERTKESATDSAMMKQCANNNNNNNDNNRLFSLIYNNVSNK